MKPETVGQLMRPNPVVVTPDTTVAKAMRVASVCGIRHVLIGQYGELSGTSCVCELSDLPPGEPIGDHIRAEPITIAAALPVHLARELMIRHRIDCLPVLRDGIVVGVVTRRDLRAAGLPLPEDACAYCGETRHVRPDPAGGPPACRDCRATMHRRVSLPAR